MTECIFCQIVRGEAPADILYQDEQVTAFYDINPAAPVHVLLVPNKHIENIDDLQLEDAAVMGHLLLVARDIARQVGVAERGYRLTTNIGQDGRQDIYHLHFHLMGGVRMPVWRYDPSKKQTAR